MVSVAWRNGPAGFICRESWDPSPPGLLTHECPARCKPHPTTTRATTGMTPFPSPLQPPPAHLLIEPVDAVSARLRRDCGTGQGSEDAGQGLAFICLQQRATPIVDVISRRRAGGLPVQCGPCVFQPGCHSCKHDNDGNRHYAIRESLQRLHPDTMRRRQYLPPFRVRP